MDAFVDAALLPVLDNSIKSPAVKDSEAPRSFR